MTTLYVVPGMKSFIVDVRPIIELHFNNYNINSMFPWLDIHALITLVSAIPLLPGAKEIFASEVEKRLGEKFDRIINMSELDDIYTDICREIDLKLSGLPVFQQFQIPLFSGWVGENGLLLSTHTESFYYEQIRRLSKQAAESFITSAFQSRRVQTAYFE